MSAEYHVGQELWRHDVNGDRRGGPTRVTVTKVGRKLVTVTSNYGRDETFRIDTGVANDAYGHAHLCTDERHAEHVARTEALARLAGHHLQFGMGGYGNKVPVETLNAIADLLDEAQP